jgi:DNA-binding PadR family transcriptional regulator
MWPRGFEFFQQFNRDLHTIFILNTIKSYPNGITYYDLQQMGNIPHSKIYREMKKLEEDGILRKVEERGEVGRQKHLYFLTEKGDQERLRIIQSLEQQLDLLSHRLNQKNQNEMKQLINEGTFKVWCSPAEFVANSEIPLEKKIEMLEDMDVDLTNLLERIRKLKKQLKKQMEESGNKPQGEKGGKDR